MAQNLQNRINDGRLLSLIRGASSFGEASAFLETEPEPRFHETVYALMEKRGLSPRDMIRKSGIERSYFYHILNGEKHPGRNMVLRIGLCLGSCLTEMNHLLCLAGFSELYVRRRWDAALIYAVTHQYTMERANDLLIEAGGEPLYSESSHE